MSALLRRQRCSSSPSSLSSFRVSWDARSGPGPLCCCRPFAARRGSSYKLISLLTALCLRGPPVCQAWMEGCEPNARGMDTEDLAQHTARATEGWKETVAGCNSIQYVWSFCLGVGGERPAKGPGQCPVFISVWRRSDSIGSVSFMLSFFPHLLSPYCMLACHSVRLWGCNDELRDCPLVLPLSWRSQSV